VTTTHTGASPDERSGIRGRRLTSGECWSWLATRREGRLCFATGRGPRSAIMIYGLTDQQMVFQIPEFSEVLQHSHGRRITFTVESAPPAPRHGHRVTVSGVAYRADLSDQQDLIDSVDLPEQWPAGITTRVMCLDLVEVEGHVYDAPG
jgi:hypothetical protein